jgi:hypothetical protein
MRATMVPAWPEGKEVILPWNSKNAKPYNCSVNSIFGRYLPKMNLSKVIKIPVNDREQNTKRDLFVHSLSFFIYLKNTKQRAVNTK